MSNEDLVKLYQSGGDSALLILWKQVQGFIRRYARRLLLVDGSRSGVTMDDLMQAGFIATMKAAGEYPESAECSFIGWLKYGMQAALLDTVGYRTKLKFKDPMRTAASLDIPMQNKKGDGFFMLGDVVEDPQAEKPFKEICNEDCTKNVYKFLAATLPADQLDIIRQQFFIDNPPVLGSNKKVYDKAIRTLRKPANRQQLLRVIEE